MSHQSQAADSSDVLHLVPAEWTPLKEVADAIWGTTGKAALRALADLEREQLIEFQQRGDPRRAHVRRREGGR